MMPDRRAEHEARGAMANAARCGTVAVSTGRRRPMCSARRRSHRTGTHALAENIPTLPIPRLPLVPDPLRRIRVPRDLEAVSARAAEAPDAGELGMTAPASSGSGAWP